MNEIIKQLESDKELLEISICDYELEDGYSFDEDIEICCNEIEKINNLLKFIGSGI